jgi:phosphatidylglycerol:prolipoprotein diacylglycerol transferase
LFHLPGVDFPVFSYGVMLGLSFVVGWYISLGLAERDGLPKEMLATCYVVTAVSALVASRLLFVVSNPDSFHGIGDVFAVRSGGMVAYGGFLGGLVGSIGYLRWKGYPLMPWADVAVPSLAAGLCITRIGCYLNGCDFGKPLEASAPSWLAKLGTFPAWDKAMGAGDGSPAFVQHHNARLLTPDAVASLPVHPTQLYESLVGLVLLVVLVLQRPHRRFRGQTFLTFAFLYGTARFALELWRDDLERGDVPPALAPHLLFPICYAIFGAAYAFGFASIIRNQAVRLVTQIAAFGPAVYAYLSMRPAEFVASGAPARLSTSQFIGVLSAAAAGLAFAMLYRSALSNPIGAMALPAWEDPSDKGDEGDEEEDDVKSTGKGAKEEASKSPKKAEPESAGESDEAEPAEKPADELEADEPAPKKPVVKKKKKAAKKAPKPAPKPEADDE